MKIIKTFVLFLVLIFAATQAEAQLSYEMMTAKSMMEKQISERVHEALGTTLSKESYSVNVDVRLVEKPVDQEKEQPLPTKIESLPSDMTLGVIDAEPLIKMYVDKIHQLENRKPQEAQSFLQKYNVSGVNIIVGIDEGFPAQYKNELGGWLRKWSSANFGTSTTTEIKPIRTPPPKKKDVEEAKKEEKKDEKKEEKKEEKPETALDKMHKIQNMLGFAMIAVALLIGAGILAYISWQGSKNELAMMEKQAQQARSAALPMSSSNNETKKEDDDTDRPAVSDESITAMRDLQELKEIRGKIMDLHSEVGLQMKNVFGLWLEGSREGMFKFATYLDCVMNEEKNAMSNLNLPPVPEEKKSVLAGVFQEMSSLSVQEKLYSSKQVYWELMASKVLGHDSLKKPFSYVSSMSVKEVKELVETQPAEAQTLLVLNLPDRLREPFLKETGLDLKRKVIKQALNLEMIETKDMELLSEAVKATATKIKSGSYKQPVLPLAAQVLRDMDEMEEISVLREITPNLKDRGVSLKLSFTTLSFMDEWKDEWIRTLAERTQPEHWVTLLRAVPDLQSKVMPVMPTGLQEIVKDDLNLADKSKASEKDRLLKELKYYLQIALDEMGQTPSDLYQWSEDANVSAKAA